MSAFKFPSASSSSSSGSSRGYRDAQVPPTSGPLRSTTSRVRTRLSSWSRLGTSKAADVDVPSSSSSSNSAGTRPAPRQGTDAATSTVRTRLLSLNYDPLGPCTPGWEKGSTMEERVLRPSPSLLALPAYSGGLVSSSSSARLRAPASSSSLGLKTSSSSMSVSALSSRSVQTRSTCPPRTMAPRPLRAMRTTSDLRPRD